MRRTLFPIIPVLLILAACSADRPAGDALPSWNDGAVKESIDEWLTAVTDPAHPDYIPVPERVAVFDNDGTSWCERPDYTPTTFQVDLARSLAARGEIDGQTMPFSAWFSGDRQALRDFGYHDAYAQLNAAFAGMPVTAYRDSANTWLQRARHSRYDVPYTDLYYAPMLELMALLKENEFQIWIVTGAAQDFVRAYVDSVIGIAPEHVIGTWTTPVYRENEDGSVTIVRGDVQTGNGYENKPVNIETRLGRRPVFAAGNSNNDQPMCRYAVTGARRGLALWVHHDDDEREYEYGRTSGGIADLCRDHARAHRISMKDDWNTLYRKPVAAPATASQAE